jgi:alpha-glucosidase
MCQSGPVLLSSPDGKIQASFSTEATGQLVYEIAFNGKPVIGRSNLGLELQDQPMLGGTLRIVTSRPGKIDETYTVPAGKSNPVHDQANTVAIDLQDDSRAARKLTLEARAYNDGIAFRYVIPDQPRTKTIRIVNERTQFAISGDATTYPLILRNFHTSYEDDYRTVSVSGLHPEALIALPLLLELPGRAWFAITEAHIENYAGMYLMRSRANNSRILEARLAPHVDEPGIAVVRQTPAESPWRVLMIADSPGRLIESNIVENLNPASVIADTSWIKPGKAAWDWWSGPFDEGADFKVGKNTATAKHYVDFAAKAGFEYFLLDGGWSARGTGANEGGSDITRAQPSIDMPELLRYAKSKNVKVWLWAHWTDVNRQIDEAFALYEQWGIAGVKIDFMDRDDQWMVDFYHRAAKKAAEHHLMIDFHGAYKPDGLRRTYPNVITREGVMGLEYNKWSTRITPDHNLMLAFTRMLAGPMDYTPGGFMNVTREAFEPRNVHPMVMGTRAHQVALFVVFESPFEMVSDYPEAYDGQRELPFLSEVPTTWDETRVINGKPGDYITIARRHGKEWYVGSIAGSHPAQIDIPLEFLGSGEYAADTISDAPDAAVSPGHTTIEQKKVNRSQRIKAMLAAGGGQAIRIRPAQ